MIAALVACDRVFVAVGKPAFVRMFWKNEFSMELLEGFEGKNKSDANAGDKQIV